METPLGCLQELLKLVRLGVLGIETVSSVKRFSNDQPSLNLKTLGKNKGVRHFTVRNLGKTIIYVSTGTNEEREPINPDQTFAINSPHRVCDESVKIVFGPIHPDYATDTTRSDKDAIARYLVDKC